MKLLVAIDLAASTGKVLDEARSIAKAHAANVWLLHVAEPEPEFVGMDVGPQYERDALAKKFHKEHHSWPSQKLPALIGCLGIVPQKTVLWLSHFDDFNWEIRFQ